MHNISCTGWWNDCWTIPSVPTSTRRYHHDRHSSRHWTILNLQLWQELEDLSTLIHSYLIHSYPFLSTPAGIGPSIFFLQELEVFSQMTRLNVLWQGCPRVGHPYNDADADADADNDGHDICWSWCWQGCPLAGNPYNDLNHDDHHNDHGNGQWLWLGWCYLVNPAPIWLKSPPAGVRKIIFLFPGSPLVRLAVRWSRSLFFLLCCKIKTFTTISCESLSVQLFSTMAGGLGCEKNCHWFLVWLMQVERGVRRVVTGHDAHGEAVILQVLFCSSNDDDD